MKGGIEMIGRLASMVALWVAVCDPVLAVFTVAPDPTVPEPATAALFAAGALAAGGVRYLIKRKRDK